MRSRSEWSIFTDYYAIRVVQIVVPCSNRYKKIHITSAEARNYLPYIHHKIVQSSGTSRVLSIFLSICGRHNPELLLLWPYRLWVWIFGLYNLVPSQKQIRLSSTGFQFDNTTCSKVISYIYMMWINVYNKPVFNWIPQYKANTQCIYRAVQK